MALFPDAKIPRRIDTLHTGPVSVSPPGNHDRQGVSPIIKPSGSAAGPPPTELHGLPGLIGIVSGTKL